MIHNIPIILNVKRVNITFQSSGLETPRAPSHETNYLDYRSKTSDDTEAGLGWNEHNTAGSGGGERKHVQIWTLKKPQLRWFLIPEDVFCFLMECVRQGCITFLGETYELVGDDFKLIHVGKTKTFKCFQWLRTLNFSFSLNLPATMAPAAPAPTTIKSYSGSILSTDSTFRQGVAMSQRPLM